MAIIDFESRFVFVKTRKTAGTSIEIELARRIGPKAVVTPVKPCFPGHIPRNFRGETGYGNFQNHMTASRIRAQLGAEPFDSMYSFCVEREPVSKSISFFHMMMNSDLHRHKYSLSGWDEYCERGLFPVDVDRYSEERGGKRYLIVDEVLPYETLQSQMKQLSGKLGLPDFQLQVRAKAGYSHPVHIRPEDISTTQRSMIYGAFAETIQVTGLYL